MNNRSHPGSPNQTSSTLFRNYVLFYLIFILNFIWSEQPPCGTILQGASKPLFSNEINIWWPLELCFRLTQLTFDIFSLPNCPKFYLYQFFRIIKLLFSAFFDTNHLTLILSTFILLFHSDIWISKFYLNSFPFQWLSLLIVSNKWHQFRQSKWYFSCLSLTEWTKVPSGWNINDVH